MTMRARQAKRARGLTQRIGNEAQHVLGGAHDDGHDDHCERKGAGVAGEMADARHHDLIDEQSDDDRWRAEQMSLMKRTTKVSLE